jgi:hypothetical protein
MQDGQHRDGTVKGFLGRVRGDGKGVELWLVDCKAFWKGTRSSEAGMGEPLVLEVCLTIMLFYG